MGNDQVIVWEKTEHQRYISDNHSEIVSNNVMHLNSKREYAKECKSLKDNARQCQGCSQNQEGYCRYFKAWAYVARPYCKQKR